MVDHDDAVAILELVAEHAALVRAVVLDLLAVGAVANLLAVEVVKRDRRDHRKRDALVGRPNTTSKSRPKLSWMARA